MQDLWFVSARCMTWEKEAWRWPGKVGLLIREMKKIADDENATVEARAEARMLVRNLYAALKEPPVQWAKTS